MGHLRWWKHSSKTGEIVMKTDNLKALNSSEVRPVSAEDTPFN